MAHIIDFSVSGLAGREGIYSQRLNRDINLFFGLNGSGKTSLLRILHSAMINDASLLSNVPFDNAQVTIYSENYQKEFIYTIEEEKKRSSRSALITTVQLPFEIEEPSRSGLPRSRDIVWVIKPKLPDNSTGRFSCSYLPTSRLFLGERSLSYRASNVQNYALVDEVSEEQIDIKFAQYLQQLWNRYSSDILRDVRQAQADGLASIFKTVIAPKDQNDKEQFIDPKVAYRHMADFLSRQGSKGSEGTFREFSKRYDTDSSFRNVVNDINDVEERIDKALFPREQLQDLIQRMISGNKKVIFRDNDVAVESRQNRKIELFMLSSGEKHLLRILIEVLLAGRGCVFIDEPEISMHIDWQKILIGAMHELNPSAQLILATHSPEIMADIPDNRIFRL